MRHIENRGEDAINGVRMQKYQLKSLDGLRQIGYL